LLLAGAAVPHALAQQLTVPQQLPVPMPQDTRLVVFRYDANDSYLILTRPGAVTHIALEPDESVVALALGDTVQWIVQDKGPHLFVKPVRSDLYTSATLVTTHRTYQLSLRSSPEAGIWYQRVSWSPPVLLPIDRQAELARAKADAQSRAASEAAASVAETAARSRLHGEGQRLPLEKLNFAYEVRGQAAFRPVQAFDDGRFTYIRLPSALQEMPALFVLGESDAAELVNYTVRGRFLVAQRLAPRFVLRLGRAEAVVLRVDDTQGRTADARGASGWLHDRIPETTE